MTQLTGNKRIRREVFSNTISRALIVTLASDGVYVREKGRRTTYGPISYGVLLQKAAAVTAAQTERARPARRSSTFRSLLRGR